MASENDSGHGSLPDSTDRYLSPMLTNLQLGILVTDINGIRGMS